MPWFALAAGKYTIKNGDEEYTADELAQVALHQPDRFSPTLRCARWSRNYLLPTITYYGGAAEIAYFAQTAEVYRILERPATPILPRASLTMIESHTGRVLERYGLDWRIYLLARKNVSAGPCC